MAQASQVRKAEKSGVVYNGLFGKIVRTIGFAMLAIGLAIVAVTTIVALREALGSTVDNYAQYVEIIETKLQALAIPNIVFYGLAATLIGLLLVILAVGRSWFGKTLHIISFVLLLFYLIVKPGNSVLLLTGVDQAPGYIVTVANEFASVFDMFDGLIPKYPQLMGGIVTAFYVIVALSVLGNKKPRRISLSFIKAGLGLVTFLVFTHGIILPIVGDAVEFVGEFMQGKYYLIFVYGFLTLSYIFQLIGSIIGMIFFFVK